jgi:hypothetical protein
MAGAGGYRWLGVTAGPSYHILSDLFWGVPPLSFYPSQGLLGRKAPPANLKGNLLPRFEWEEYLIWRLHPQVRVGMDGRYETVYPTVLCREFLTRYPHDLILIHPEAPVAGYLPEQTGWQVSYRDTGSLLLAKIS